MKFNETNCKCVVISKRRRAKDPYPTLILGGQSLELVNSYKYLGVTVTSGLSWSLHIQQASVNAIGMLYRNLATYNNADAIQNL